jgi:hypothetical protein
MEDAVQKKITEMTRIAS